MKRMNYKILLRNKKVLNYLSYSILFSFTFLIIMNLLSLEPYVNFSYIDNKHFRQAIDHKPIDASDWVYNSDNRFINNKRGYIVSVANDESSIAGAMFSINQMRNQFLSTLPIAVAHCSELSYNTIKAFESIGEEIYGFDICKSAKAIQKKRLRSWFSKPMALIVSPFQETLIFDTDVIWFQNPDKLFLAKGYIETGALFFRDQFLYAYKDIPHKGLIYDQVVSVIQRKLNFESSYKFSSPENLYSLFIKNGVNYYWKHGVDPQQYNELQHVQESSVVMLNKEMLPKTIRIMREILPNFHLGYGDKELFWISATISRENFTFEPFLYGVYGDCGTTFHYDPTELDESKVQPFFMNAKYLSEEVTHIGYGMESVMTKPILLNSDFKLFEMGEYSPKTTCRCGACKLIGCIDVPSNIQNEIMNVQRNQLNTVGSKQSFFTWLRANLNRIKKTLYSKFIPTAFY